MTCKFLHIRAIDVNGAILPKGGVTVAYTVVEGMDAEGICINLAKCHPDDLFAYESGREFASKKLHNEGPLDVLPLEHPISYTITDWLSIQWWPSRGKYGGFIIDIFKDEKNRWVSDFLPSQPINIG